MLPFNSNLQRVIQSVAKNPEGADSPQPITASKPKSPRSSIGIRVLQFVFLAALACTVMGASDRFNDLGHKIMCPCGCSEILLECNHVGCPDSERMRGELSTQISSGIGDRPILNFFMEKYGPTALAAPMRGGFDNLAWIMPFAVLAFATLGVAFLIRKWRVKTVAAPSRAANAKFDSVRDQIRKETEY
jgi:cytochrome c-type biogenesis protein CcmH